MNILLKNLHYTLNGFGVKSTPFNKLSPPPQKKQCRIKKSMFAITHLNIGICSSSFAPLVTDNNKCRNPSKCSSFVCKMNKKFNIILQWFTIFRAVY